MNYTLILSLSITIILIIIIFYFLLNENKETFTSNFFKHKEKIYHISTTTDDIKIINIILNNFTQSIKDICKNTINIDLYKSSTNSLELLDNNDIQFSIDNANNINNNYKNYNNIRMMCALNNVPLNIISSNLMINSFTDILSSKNTINIGKKNTQEYFIAMELFAYYGINPSQLNITYYDVYDNNILNHYHNDFQILFKFSQNPDNILLQLTNKIVSKFINIKPDINFFREKNYFNENMLDTNKMFEYYPNIVRYHNVLYIDTISSPNYLLTNIFVDKCVVETILNNIKIYLNELKTVDIFFDEQLTITQLSNFKNNIEVHEGASIFFHKNGKYNNNGNDNCLYINGICNDEILKKYHLLI